MNKLIIAAVVVIIVIAGIVMFAGSQGTQVVPSPAPTETVIKEGSSPTPVVIEEEGVMTEKASVEIKDFAFGPKTLTIKKGTTVTWTNQDSVAHTATADEGSFDIGLLTKGESGSITFDEVGTYTYHCTPHPNMKATIIVE